MLQDNPVSGKWELPGIVTQSETQAIQVKKLHAFLASSNVVTLGLEKDYSDVSQVLTKAGEQRASKNIVLVAKEVLSYPEESPKWKTVSKAQALKLGNLDGLTRRYLMNLQTDHKTAFSIVKKASGPKEDHRSVSAVLKKGDNILVMEHPYQKIWSIPKGHIDPGETAREAVVRELEEELGVKAEGLELMTWYTENYKNGSETPTQVKHYNYEVTAYTGEPVNKERDKHGNITLKWMPVTSIPKHESMSLMTLKAVDELVKRKKGAGFFKYLAALPVLAYTGYTGGSMIFPQARQKHLRNLRKNFKTISGEVPSYDSISGTLGGIKDGVGDAAVYMDNEMNNGFQNVQERVGNSAISLNDAMQRSWAKIKK